MKKFFFIAGLSILLIIGISQIYKRISSGEEAKKTIKLRKPAVSGLFYPASPQQLKKTVQDLLKKEKQLPELKNNQLIGLIVPHAGYIFSGHVAAAAYKQLYGLQIDTAIIIGQSHLIAFEGIALPEEDYYATPLGNIKCDKELAKELVHSAKGKQIKIFFSAEATKKEHSLEVQLPFLQVIFKDNIKILPILIGKADYRDLKILAELLLKIMKNNKNINKNIIIIASTDLSHYPPYEVACRVDKITLELIEKLDINGLLKLLNTPTEQVDCYMCGASCVITTLLVALGLSEEIKAKVIKYSNSGDVPYGDKNRCVGYGAVAIYKILKKGREKEMKLEQKMSNEAEKILLRIARQSIMYHLQGKEGFGIDIATLPEELKEKRGAFVTLTKDGQLRGCIGQFTADKPLYEVVAEMAIAAATQDMRFFYLPDYPITLEQLDKIKIEISVLSPLELIDDIDKIELGKHGIYIQRGGKAGCFLPQVAVETGWSKEEFLERCCVDKAGLPKDAWKQPGTKIYIFTAHIIHED